jgi:TolB-like protein/class 3 adenylate cyclase/Flp pilus assembly protein TadD
LGSIASVRPIAGDVVIGRDKATNQPDSSFALDASRRTEIIVGVSKPASESRMSTEVKKEVALEIAYVLFIDIVGYSKLLINEQGALVDALNRIVRSTEEFRRAEEAGRLIKIPVGDGMALVFYDSPETPVECALQISRLLKQHPALRLRMGVHSGPVSGVVDVNERTNVAGAGINIAQRVMDCGDTGHILLSKRVAEDLGQYAHWQPHLHDLGECEVKHGARVSVVNLYTDDLGNPTMPHKVAASHAADAKKKRVALRSISLGALALLVAVFVISFLLFHNKGPSLATGSAILAKSIAVLPLENLTEEKENAYFADGIQDELLSNLAKIKDLKVISRTSVMQYKSGITRNLKEIAQQLGVGNVVEGSVRRSGNHIRVSVQLIDALTDRHIWAQNYDRTLADSLALQGELATEIAAGVGATLSPQEKARVQAKPTNNPAAYDAYLRGRALAGGSPFDKSNVERTIQSYQEAVKLDPTFVLAWAYLSCEQSSSYWLGHDSSPARLAAAKDSVDRALTLDPNLPETHLALGYYRYWGQRDFTGGLAEFQQAEKGLPNNVDVIFAMALIHRRLGHWKEAIDRFRRVVELDPRNTKAYGSLALTYGSLRRFPEALDTVDRVLAWEPTNTGALDLKAFLFSATGDLQAVEPLLANPATEPSVPGASSLVRGMQALFQRRYTAAIEVFSSEVAAETKRGEPSDNEKLLLGLSQQRAGDVAAARATYQEAAKDIRRELEKVAPGTFQEGDLYAALGLAHAGLGEAASAIAEGQKAMAIRPTSKDPYEGPKEEENMAGIYALLGDADHAIPILKRLLQIPYNFAITPALLRLDPVWDQIRNDPHFQELSAEKKP